MSEGYFLVHDLGTSSDKATLYDVDGRKIDSMVRHYKTYHDRPQWAEQSPKDWWQAVCETTQLLLKKTKISSKDILAVSFSGQMMGVIPLNKDGELLMDKVIIWEDMRAFREARYLEENIGWEEFYRKTGGGMALEMYPLVKILWLKNNFSKVYEQAYKFLQCKDYIVFRLTGELKTEYTEASNTGLLNIWKKTWDSELLEFIGLDFSKLPEIQASHEIVGEITEEASRATGLRIGTPVISGAGDVPASSLGAGLTKEEVAYISTGTAWWGGILTNQPMISPEHRVTTLCSMIPGKYTPHNFVHSGSACIEWFIDQFLPIEREISKKLGTTIYKFIEKQAEKALLGARGLIFLPYLMGGGAPHQKEWIKGGFLGLTLAHNKGHMIRAIMEGVALTIRNVIEIFERGGAKIRIIKMIGGSALNTVWRKIAADVLGKTVYISQYALESTGLAAAVAAGIGVGIYKSYDFIDKVSSHNVIEINPDMKNYGIYTKIYEIYRDLWKKLDDFYEKFYSTCLESGIV